jgi:hypothetical protein
VDVYVGRVSTHYPHTHTQNLSFIFLHIVKQNKVIISFQIENFFRSFFSQNGTINLPLAHMYRKLRNQV